MLVVGVMVAIVGGSVGVYFAFVDDTEYLFALGTAVMAAGVLAAFTGRLPQVRRTDRPVVGEALATLAYIVLALALFVAGSVGVLLGFTDDWEWAFLLGLVAWAASVYLVFRGELGMPAAAVPRSGGFMTALYVTGVVAATLASSAGVYFAFVEDIEYLMLLGLAGWAAVVVTTFRGSLAR